MNILSRFTLKSIRMNKKRTIVTIIGIVLATALITTVANFAVSFRASMIEYEKKASGNFHYIFHDVSADNLKYFENNRAIENLGHTAELGYALLPDGKNEDKPYLYFMMADDDAFSQMSMQLIEGRLPENDHEIVISKHIWTNGGVQYQVGDTITVDMGNRYRISEESDSEEAATVLNQQWDYCYDSEEFVSDRQVTYTVVGIMERPIYQIEMSTAPGYTVIVGWNEETAPAQQTLYATYTKEGLHNREAVTAGLLDIPLELYQRWEAGQVLTDSEYEQVWHISDWIESNQWLIKWEIFNLSGDTMRTLYIAAAIAIAIIIVTSVFCIRNSFVISLTEKMKLYGMLSSLGTTRRQRKRLVYQEALLLGLIGIPIGIGVGILATWILVHVTTALAENALAITLVFAVSIPAMILAVVLSLITIVLSAGQSARKAAKVSPITAIRGNELLRQRKKNLKVPRFVKRIFGIGGVLAYKNLKRARVKYRTTVISIVVSVAVFIGMSSLLRLGKQTETIYYQQINYQMIVSLFGDNQQELAERIAKQEGVTYSEIRRMTDYEIPAEDMIPTKEFQKACSDSYTGSEDVTMKELMNMADGATMSVCLVTIGDEAFDAYCSQLGLDADAMQGKAILANDFQETVTEHGKNKQYSGMCYEYKTGDILSGTIGGDNSAYEPLPYSVELAAVTDVRPISIEDYTGGAYLIVRDDFFEQAFGDTADRNKYSVSSCGVYIQCEDSDALELILSDMLVGTGDYYITNMKSLYESTQSLYLLLSVFLYGFIIVIACIGVTNIFNTITTNMELRTREFAMLKSIGMTSREFRRMVCMESVFYSVKSLGIGIPIGILISLGFYQAFAAGIMEFSYHIPYESILISILAVIVLLVVIMWYSMAKINRKNILDAIQTENI